MVSSVGSLKIFFGDLTVFSLLIERKRTVHPQSQRRDLTIAGRAACTATSMALNFMSALLDRCRGEMNSENSHHCCEDD